MQPRLKKSFRNKILQSLLVLTLLPLLAWGVVSYQKAFENHTDAYEQQLRESAENLRQQVDLWHDHNLETLRALVHTLAKQPTSAWPEVISDMRKTEPLVFARITDTRGRIVLQSEPIKFDQAEDEALLQKASEGDYFFQKILSREDGQGALCSIAPVVQKQTVRYVATLCNPLQEIAKAFQQTHLGKTGQFMLLGPKGRILAHPQLNFREAPTSWIDRTVIERAMNGELGRQELQDPQGGEFAAYIAAVDRGWKIVSLQSRAEISDLSQRSLIWPFWSGFLIVLALVMLNSFFVDRTTAPLHRLARYVRRFGQGDLHVRAPVESNDELGVLAVSFNLMATQIRATIEELKRKEQELARNRDELHQLVSQQSQKLLFSAKMSSLGEMAGGIAHEVNNPLAIISLKAQKIQEGLKSGRLSPKESVEMASQIEETCMRINKIIRGLKTFSRDGSRDPLVMENLSTILTDTENLCGESLRARGIQLNLICPAETWIECQPVQMSQLFLNLIMNARDAIAALPEKWISIEACDVDDQVLIKITDSGRGIPEPIRSQMMQPFFTTKRVGEGTGLGLSICSGIIEQHQGTFIYNVDSESTQFIIRLPRQQKKSPPRSPLMF